ncbi:hypothetical protein [Chitinivorax sp. B]|uniref:hypothetical protein n=1 Tax=Chitinivorax sp. B TaxID=2502235 RepID=UPI0010F496B6|nr:hypothetical protein [Chitinivorax sp. B]
MIWLQMIWRLLLVGLVQIAVIAAGWSWWVDGLGQAASYLSAGWWASMLGLIVLAMVLLVPLAAMGLGGLVAFLLGRSLKLAIDGLKVGLLALLWFAVCHGIAYHWLWQLQPPVPNQHSSYGGVFHGLLYLLGTCYVVGSAILVTRLLASQAVAAPLVTKT